MALATWTGMSHRNCALIGYGMQATHESPFVHITGDSVTTGHHHCDVSQRQM